MNFRAYFAEMRNIRFQRKLKIFLQQSVTVYAWHIKRLSKFLVIVAEATSSFQRNNHQTGNILGLKTRLFLFEPL
jgi:hypothetical protein